MEYLPSILFTQRFNRTEQQIDLSVGHWKQELQRQKHTVCAGDKTA
jgi:hypothetical protein